jgi:hypothetical protein
VRLQNTLLFGERGVGYHGTVWILVTTDEGKRWRS